MVKLPAGSEEASGELVIGELFNPLITSPQLRSLWVRLKVALCRCVHFQPGSGTVGVRMGQSPAGSEEASGELVIGEFGNYSRITSPR